MITQPQKVKLPGSTSWWCSSGGTENGRGIEYWACFNDLMFEVDGDRLKISGKVRLMKCAWIFGKPISWLPPILQLATVWTAAPPWSYHLYGDLKNQHRYRKALLNKLLEGRSVLMSDDTISTILEPVETELNRIAEELQPILLGKTQL